VDCIRSISNVSIFMAAILLDFPASQKSLSTEYTENTEVEE